MQALALTSPGRIALHLAAMLLDHEFAFHWAGIVRELPGVAVA